MITTYTGVDARMKLNCAVCYAELNTIFEGKLAMTHTTVTTPTGTWVVGSFDDENDGLWARCPDHPPSPSLDAADQAFAVVLERIREVAKKDPAEARRLVARVEGRLNAALASVG